MKFILDKIEDSKRINAFGNKEMMQVICRYDYDENNRLYFTIVKDSIDEKFENGEPSSYLLITRLNNTWQVKGTQVFPKFEKRTIATTLYYYVICGEIGTLISDTQMFDDAERLWNRMMKTNNLKVSIYDKITQDGVRFFWMASAEKMITESIKSYELLQEYLENKPMTKMNPRIPTYGEFGVDS
jgi:hypothetical protein